MQKVLKTMNLLIIILLNMGFGLYGHIVIIHGWHRRLDASVAPTMAYLRLTQLVTKRRNMVVPHHQPASYVLVLLDD